MFAEGGCDVGGQVAGDLLLERVDEEDEKNTKKNHQLLRAAVVREGEDVVTVNMR